MQPYIFTSNEDERGPEDVQHRSGTRCPS